MPSPAARCGWTILCRFLWLSLLIGGWPAGNAAALPLAGYISISGSIVDEQERPVPYATIRILPTNTGTISDAHGKFLLRIPAARRTIQFSYIGYETVRMTLDLFRDTVLQIRLLPADIRLEAVEVIGEDPAIPVIRSAIERKQRQSKQLHSYIVRVYSKDTFGSDTLLAMISEAYSELVWTKNDPLRERILFRKQSTNIPEQLQIARVHEFIDFLNDTVRHWGYSFLTPLSDSAFSLYHFALTSSYHREGKKYFDIAVTPRSRTAPLFSGTITVSDSDFVLHRIRLRPNNVFHIPFAAFSSFEFHQQFHPYGGRFWLPLECRITSRFRILYMYQEIGQPLNYTKTAIAYDYRINEEVTEGETTSTAEKIVPSTPIDDTASWNGVTLFPLSELERKSYRHIDEQMRSLPALVKWMLTPSAIKPIVDRIVLRYNRVEGLFTGYRSVDNVSELLRINSGIGFGFADTEVKYWGGAELRIVSGLPLWIGAEHRRSIATFPVNYSVNEVWGTISVLFNGADHFNYFRTTGNSMYLLYDDGMGLRLRGGLFDERHATLTKQTDFVLNYIGTDRLMRDNPPIDDGRFTILRTELRWQSDHTQQQLFFPETNDRWSVLLEHAPASLSNVRQYSLFLATGNVRIPVAGTSTPFYPYLQISAAAGGTFGAPPVQKSFSLESPVSRIVSSHSFRTVSVDEFSGDRMLSASVEYNFRNFPLLSLDLRRPVIDLILRVSAGNVWSESAMNRRRLRGTDEPYVEYTAGFGRIADLLRLDFSYAPYGGERFSVSLTGGF